MSLGKVVTVDIKYYDYVKLSPHNYVNDTIINFFLKYQNLYFLDLLKMKL